MWSRAVNIKVCTDLTVSKFLLALQMHIYEEGVPNKIFSDSGSQITSAANQISKYLDDVKVKEFFVDTGIEKIEFFHYFKGDSSLGSLVEICVKLVKRLLFGSIRNNVLEREEFDLIVSKTIHLVNSRPIAFKESLRDCGTITLPDPITPELLTKGRHLSCMNVVPRLDNNCDDDNIDIAFESEGFSKDWDRIRRVRDRLIGIYNEEFINTLIVQSTDKNNRYKPVLHHKLEVGDVVLLKEPHLKANQYPLARVTKIYSNILDEVTDVEVLKGRTEEVVKRHVTSVIPYLRCEPPDDDCSESEKSAVKTDSRPSRAAAIASRQLTKHMLG